MDNQFPLPGPSPLPPINVDNQVTPLPNPEEAAPPPPGYQPPASAKPPVVKSSPLKIIIPVVVALIIISIIAFVLFRVIGQGADKQGTVSPGQSVTLTYWGLWEPIQVMKPVIDEFERQNPKIKVSYQLQSPQDYQDRMKTALESDTTPDIVRMHSTWLPIFAKNLLVALPDTVSATDMQTNFPPIVSKLLVSSNQVYGIPMTVDGLGLYVNTAMFQQKSLEDPKNWNDILTAAKTLKEVDPLTGKITRAGIALGNTTNIDHWPDIVTLMLMQAGVNLTDPQGKTAEDTLGFYTDFVTKHRVWDDTLPTSTVAFANEKVAMIFAPIWRAQEIKQINPSLAWKIIPVPQLPDSDVVNWTSIWFEAVPKGSKYPKEAWLFLDYLSSAKAQQLLFEAAAKDREFPQPPAHKSLASLAQNNPFSAPYIQGIDTAKTFYTASNTRDSKTSLNSRLIKYLEDGVNGVALNQEITRTLETMSLGFNQVLSQYGLVSATQKPATQR